jgi:hypothetical protein
VVTQDRSKVLRETEQNPFEAEEDNEEEPPSPTVTKQPFVTSTPVQSSGSSTPNSFFSPLSPTSSKKPKKEKAKKGKKPKAFNLEAEKETMKNCIAEASVASTNLLNALRHINREHEQISENQAAVKHFEICKLLRRKILRYVRGYFSFRHNAD